MNKYTVIIPTRDRAETLAATLRTCLRQTYENFEILVSDNCSSDNTKEVVGQFRDPRVRYINPGRRLSMTGHFEFALGHITDGFVMFIGSDDGIMPDAIDYVESIVKKYGVEAVSCAQATYVWPDFPEESIAGRLTFGGMREGVEIRHAPEWINKALQFQTPYCFDLPNLYCGFVHKRIIDKAYKNGQYFRSITPDAYSAFATAIFIDTYAFSYKPFSIAGASTKSNGASSMHPKGDLTESSKFYLENDIDISDGFVNCPSFEIILSEAFAQVAQAFPERCVEYRLNYSTMLQKAVENANDRTKKEVIEAVNLMLAHFSEEIQNAPIKPIDKVKKASFRQRFDYLMSLIKIIAVPKSAAMIIAVPKSASIGVRNVDDAALLAHILLQDYKKKKFMTRGDLVWPSLKKIIGF